MPPRKIPTDLKFENPATVKVRISIEGGSVTPWLANESTMSTKVAFRLDLVGALHNVGKLDFPLTASILNNLARGRRWCVAAAGVLAPARRSRWETTETCKGSAGPRCEGHAFERQNKNQRRVPGWATCEESAQKAGSTFHAVRHAYPQWTVLLVHPAACSQGQPAHYLHRSAAAAHFKSISHT